jgi:hypothetical protein
VLGHCRSDLGELLAEAEKVVVLRALLLRPVLRVVEVLVPPGTIDADGLELRALSRGDPDVAPRRRDAELVDALELRVVGDLPTPRVVIAKAAALLAAAAPTPGPRHESSLTGPAPL